VYADIVFVEIWQRRGGGFVTAPQPHHLGVTRVFLHRLDPEMGRGDLKAFHHETVHETLAFTFYLYQDVVFRHGAVAPWRNPCDFEEDDENEQRRDEILSMSDHVVFSLASQGPKL